MFSNALHRLKKIGPLDPKTILIQYQLNPKHQRVSIFKYVIQKFFLKFK